MFFADPAVFQVGFSSLYMDEILILSPTATELTIIVEDLKGLYELRVADDVEMFLEVQFKWKLDSDRQLTSLTLTRKVCHAGLRCRVQTYMFPHDEIVFHRNFGRKRHLGCRSDTVPGDGGATFVLGASNQIGYFSFCTNFGMFPKVANGLLSPCGQVGYAVFTGNP